MRDACGAGTCSNMTTTSVVAAYPDDGGGRWHRNIAAAYVRPFEAEPYVKCFCGVNVRHSN